MTETPRNSSQDAESIDIPLTEGQPGASAGNVPEPEDGPAQGPAGVSGVPMEPTHEAVARLEEELDGLRDRHARLGAEFDNYRKRTSREHLVLVERAQAALAIKVLDVLDDLDRILDGMDEATPAEALREAIELVDKKLRKELTAAGLERIDTAGVPFDPSVHEAVATAPPPGPDDDNHVGATFQAGYLFKGNLIRPARVQVFSDQGQG
jgi:molecular chaperone GrpE